MNFFDERVRNGRVTPVRQSQVNAGTRLMR
jgi:hypothetical protein